jgi:phosphoglycolate phosphatase
MKDYMVLIDIDGTLIHTGGAGMRALDRALEAEYGLKNAFAGYSFAGKTDQRILKDGFTRWLNRLPEPQDYERCQTAYLRFLDEELTAAPDQYVILPGVVELLERLRDLGIPTGLATGNLKAGARRKLEVGNLWKYFPFGGFGSDAEHRGELTLRGIERGRTWAGRHIPAPNVLVVGDSPLDIEAAHYAGARSLAVLTGWTESAKLSSSEFLMDDLSDTEAVMQAVFSH